MEAFLPKDFNDYEWEIESKGWYDAKIISEIAEDVVSFYDPIRLQQDVEDSLLEFGVFFGKNIFIVNSVNRKNM